MKSPVTLYLVHHPKCAAAEHLSSRLYHWFRLGYLNGDQSGAGLPVFFRRQLHKNTIAPGIQLEDARLNVIVILADEAMIADSAWRNSIVRFVDELHKHNQESDQSSNSVVLPVALHESFYRLGPLYENFNPVRLIGLSLERAEAALRRAVTEATARSLRTQSVYHSGPTKSDSSSVPAPLKVFLSHAKADGMAIAEHLRDGVRKCSQLEAWYDANDLPYGSSWSSPMASAAAIDTAAMVVTLTDRYPSRPWCRREASLARTPCKLPGTNRVWRVQPVVAVEQPGPQWVRGLPMLEGVPHIGWNDASRVEITEQVVDRLVLEVMLMHTHCTTAAWLASDPDADPADVYMTWTPDSWTLASLRHQLNENRVNPSSIRRIIYPGFGLSNPERQELLPLLSAFHRSTRLCSFEECWR